MRYGRVLTLAIPIVGFAASMSLAGLFGEDCSRGEHPSKCPVAEGELAGRPWPKPYVDFYNRRYSELSGLWKSTRSLPTLVYTGKIRELRYLESQRGSVLSASLGTSRKVTCCGGHLPALLLMQTECFFQSIARKTIPMAAAFVRHRAWLK